MVGLWMWRNRAHRERIKRMNVIGDEFHERRFQG